MKIYFTPFRIEPTKQDAKAVATDYDRPTRKGKGNLFTFPNADAFMMFLYLAGGSKSKPCLSGGNFPLMQKEQVKYGHAVSLFGLMRALIVLRKENPKVFERLVALAKLLSYTIDEETKEPPFSAWITENLTIKGIFSRAERELGLTLKDYQEAVIDFFLNGGLTLFVGDLEKEKRPADAVALFSSNPEENKKAIMAFLEGKYVNPDDLFEEEPLVEVKQLPILPSVVEELKKKFSKDAEKNGNNGK